MQNYETKIEEWVYAGVNWKFYFEYYLEDRLSLLIIR